VPLEKITMLGGAARVMATLLTKKASASGKRRVLGSIAHVGACRANYLFATDPGDPADTRVRRRARKRIGVTAYRAHSTQSTYNIRRFTDFINAPILFLQNISLEQSVQKGDELFSRIFLGRNFLHTKMSACG
jgi:hypothetical protein